VCRNEACLLKFYNSYSLMHSYKYNSFIGLEVLVVPSILVGRKPAIGQDTYPLPSPLTLRVSSLKACFKLVFLTSLFLWSGVVSPASNMEDHFFSAFGDCSFNTITLYKDGC
jgi:hypothetical protein